MEPVTHGARYSLLFYKDEYPENGLKLTCMLQEAPLDAGEDPFSNVGWVYDDWQDLDVHFTVVKQYIVSSTKHCA